MACMASKHGTCRLWCLVQWLKWLSLLSVCISIYFIYVAHFFCDLYMWHMFWWPIWHKYLFSNGLSSMSKGTTSIYFLWKLQYAGAVWLVDQQLYCRSKPTTGVIFVQWQHVKFVPFVWCLFQIQCCFPWLVSSSMWSPLLSFLCSTFRTGLQGINHRILTEHKIWIHIIKSHVHYNLCFIFQHTLATYNQVKLHVHFHIRAKTTPIRRPTNTGTKTDESSTQLPHVEFRLLF
jgi:hypothetical protein